jgi:DAK2 domain fusion protein YloV
MLLGARGNSGVILSQFFAGMTKGFSKFKKANAVAVAKAMQEGVKQAYASVITPTEGTILTVAREAVEYATSKTNDKSTITELFTNLIKEMYASLQRTPDLLAALKEANVIDSGGAGYVYVAQGMLSALSGEEIAVTLDSFDTQNTTETADFSLFTSDSQMVYGYCTEVIIRLQKSKVDVENFSVDTLINKLKEYDCDSIVCYKFDDAVKLHTHTFTPGIVLNECQKYGEFLQLKIENMTLEHSETQEKQPPKVLGVVAVCNGDGLKELFTQLGADFVIDGGQTLNPSAGDFIKAFDKVNAENIIVLPNNSNIYLSAKQAEEMYTAKKVSVVPVKTIQEGYVALSVINPDSDDIETQISDIKSAIEYVDSIEVTYAVRDAIIGDKLVKKGEFMAIFDGKLLAVGSDKIQTTLKAIKAINDEEEKEICTVFLGKNLTNEEVDHFTEVMEENFPDLSINLLNGGQDVYDFLISLE